MVTKEEFIKKWESSNNKIKAIIAEGASIYTDKYELSNPNVRLFRNGVIIAEVFYNIIETVH
jgi:hypothetical protein